MFFVPPRSKFDLFSRLRAQSASYDAEIVSDGEDQLVLIVKSIKIFESSGAGARIRIRALKMPDSSYKVVAGFVSLRKFFYAVAAIGVLTFIYKFMTTQDLHYLKSLWIFPVSGHVLFLGTLPTKIFGIKRFCGL